MTEPSRFSSPPPFKAFPVPFAVIGRSFGTTCLLFAIGFCFFRPFFVTGDDPLMGMIAEGAGKDLSQPSELLIFTNVLLGLPLKVFYSAFPQVPWYGLLHLSVFFFSMLVFTFLILQENFNWKKTALFLVFFPLEFFHYFANFEFSFTAFWAAQSGLFLLFDSVQRKSPKKFIFASLFLIFLSALFRVEITFLVLVVSVPFCFFEFFRFEPGQKKTLLASTTILAVFLLAATAFDRSYYGRFPGWKGFFPYLHAYAQVVEYRNLEASPDLPLILHSVGWDDLDFQLFKNWFWQGPQFGLDKLEKITSEAGSVFTGKTTGWEWLFKTDFLLHRSLILALFLFFTARKKYFLELLNFLWVILLFFCFFYFRKTVSWIVWPLFSYMTFLCLYYAEPGGPSLLSTGHRPSPAAKWGWVALALWAAVSFPALLGEWRGNRVKVEKEERIENDIRALAPRKDRLYVVWATLGGFPLDQLSVFGNGGLFKGFPIYSLTWEQNTPAAKALLARFNIQDLGPGMVDRKDVYFIAKRDFLGLYGQYLREHYRINPAFHWVFHGNTFDAYQVVRDSPGRLEPQGSK